MFRALLRTVVVVVIVAAAAAFFLGYQWRDLASPGRDVDRPAIDAPGPPARPDVSAARERGARAGEAIGTAAERAGQRASEAASEAGEILSDAALTAKIKSKMALDDNVTAGSIGVKTKDGHVTVSGTVASEDERRRALQLARETKGVRSVDDRLTLRH
jgi:hyperosmotically inducible protein